MEPSNNLLTENMAETVKTPRVRKTIVTFKPDTTVRKLKNPNAELQSVINQVGNFLYEKTCTTGINGCLGAAQVIKGVVKKREDRYVCQIPSSASDQSLLRYLRSMISHAAKQDILMTIEVV